MENSHSGKLNRDQDGTEHWLARPGTVRRLWIGFLAMLAITLLAQAVVVVKSYHGVDGWPGFAAGFGFLSCLLLVLLAKALGVLLKRQDRYYDA